MSSIRNLIDDGISDTDDRPQSVIKPYVLSHGTLAVHDLSASRKFYEEFLGLKCVQHASTALAFHCGLKFYVVCLQLGERAQPCHVHNHWGLDVETRQEVDSAHQDALRLKEQYGIKRITKPSEQHGVYSFYIEDLDSNFWEIQHGKGYQHDKLFDPGERFTPDGKPLA